MKIVIALDSFKGSLSAPRACKLVAEAILSVVPTSNVIIKPMADGGEGTARAMIAALYNGQWVDRTVTGPFGDTKVDAGFGWFPNEKMAVVEMAEASGLERIPPEKRNPLKTTTYGTGELIAAALEKGAEWILLAVGGSATVDGGLGAAAALGWGFLDSDGDKVEPCGGELLNIAKIVPPNDFPPPQLKKVKVLCDVDNPMCGRSGAAVVYGPQKGATPEMVKQLKKGLAHLAKLVKKQLSCNIAKTRRGGAAGGLAAGAIAFMDAELVSGIETIIIYSRIGEVIAGADWVITGEGRFDSQSLRGKVISGVVNLAKISRTRVAVLAGEVALKPAEYQKFGVDVAVDCINGGMTVDEAMENAPKLLVETARKFANQHLVFKWSD